VNQNCKISRTEIFHAKFMDSFELRLGECKKNIEMKIEQIKKRKKRT